MGKGEGEMGKRERGGVRKRERERELLQNLQKGFAPVRLEVA